MYSGILFPTIDPVAVHLGIFAVRWYSLAYIFGIIGAWLLARQMSRYSKSVFTVLKIDDFLIWATIGIVAGGRLGYVLFYNVFAGLYFRHYRRLVVGASNVTLFEKRFYGFKNR